MYLSKFILRLNSNTFTSSVADCHSSLTLSLEVGTESQITKSPRVADHKKPREQQNKPIYIGREAFSAVSASCRDQSQHGHSEAERVLRLT